MLFKFLITLTVLLGWPTASKAFVHINVHQPTLPASRDNPTVNFVWDGKAPEISDKYAINEPEDTSLSDVEYLEVLIEEAFREWNAVPTSFLELRLEGQDPETEIDDGDAINSIIIDDTGSLSAAAFAIPTTESSDSDAGGIAKDPKIIHDCDINISQDKTPARSLLSTLIHELGHCIGLGHPHTNASSIMSYSGQSDQTNLGLDDRAGITFLYPTDPGEVRELVSCGVIGTANPVGLWLLLMPCLLLFWPSRSSYSQTVPTTTQSAITNSSDNAGEELFRQIYNEPYLTKLTDIDAAHSTSGSGSSLRYNAAVPESSTPYSGYWFPEAYQGTNGPIRGNDSSAATRALEAYDQAFPSSSGSALAWERQNHSDTTTSWYGHCNGFAAAANRHENPGRTVYRPDPNCNTNGSSPCVAFTPVMQRALLAEVYMNAIARFLTGRRCEVPKPNLSSDLQNRVNPRALNECDDPNPGEMHLVLTNWLGRKQHNLVADHNRDQQVWNYPVISYSYSYEENGRLYTPQEALVKTGSTRYNTYAFNPDAQRMVIVNLELRYADALGFEDYAALFNQPDNPLNARPRIQNLRYLLELDNETDRNIIGGEWLGSANGQPGSKAEHPDFVWIPFEPSTPSGNRTGANPYVSAQKVFEIWQEATGENLGDSRRLTLPSDREIWGRNLGYYYLQLDNQPAGVAFLGKEIRLSIFPENGINAATDVEVRVNGTTVARSTINPGSPETVLINQGADPLVRGVNELELRFTQGSSSFAQANRTFRFYAMR